jgi:hypothetical protein
MAALAGFLIEILVCLLIDIFFHWTGEVFLFVVTLGRRKPVFRLGGSKAMASPSPVQNSSAFVGLLFWVIVAVVFASCLN